MIDQQKAAHVEPIVKQITVDLTLEAAFRRFTEGIDEWWPKRTHSVWMEETARVEMQSSVGGSLVEHHKDGRQSVWGTIKEWDPPHRIAFTWHPGRDESSEQLVAVEFSVIGDRTRVDLIHSNWEALGEEASKMREGYVSGWDQVLGQFLFI